MVAPGGCGGTRVLIHAAPPQWARTGFSPGAGDWTLPWALSDSGHVVAHLFARQLVAGGDRPDRSSNKVLWAVHDLAASLQVVAHPDASPKPRITVSGQMTNGNQLPSIVDLPRPGCWAFAISWGAGPTMHDSLSLQVLPAGSSPPH
ncbi:MAG TPA: hypothetical protein VF160_13390 [Candidatus Dormibacteraeota bacterium]